MAVKQPTPISSPDSVSVNGADITPDLTITTRPIPIASSFVAKGVATSAPAFMNKPVLKKPVYAFAGFNIDSKPLSYLRPILKAIRSAVNFFAKGLVTASPTSIRPVMKVINPIKPISFAAKTFTNTKPYAVSPVTKVIKPSSMTAKSYLSNASPSTVKPVIKVIVPNRLGVVSFSNSSPTINNSPVLK